MQILTNIKDVIATGLITGLMAIGSFLGITPEQVPQEIPQEEVLGSTSSVLPIAGTVYYLAGSGVSSSATSITLTSLTIPQNGYKIQDSDVSSTFYITLEPGSTARQEIVSCTTVTQNANGTATLSGCIRGLSPVQPYTASSTLQFAHAGGSKVIFSNAPQLYDDIIDYIDGVAIAGAPDSSATVKGLVEVATISEASSTASIGSGNTTAPLAITTALTSASSTIGTQVIPVTNTSGKLRSSWIDFSATTTFSGPAVFSSSVSFASSTTVRVYTASTTWSKPSNLSYVVVEVQAGGGGGGAARDSGTSSEGAGGGGGGGGYCKKQILASSLSTTEAITVGVGGTAGALGGTGGTGATSSFGSHCSANGGTGGGEDTVFGTGGTATGGDLNIQGGAGNPGQDNGETAAPMFSGKGGDSRLGFGGAFLRTSGSGNNGQLYGGAGGGGLTLDNGSYDGGVGAQGVVIVTEYFN